MPPQSSLPLRDGRVGLPPSSSSFVSASSHHGEPYSDDDINLIHEIVTLAESLFPTLPEHDRLPTHALFQAAEEILPQHGYDPDNAPSHLSRLIFKIGGQRSGETLLDKFRTVVEGMGIKLLFDSSSSADQSPAAKSTTASSSESPPAAVKAQPQLNRHVRRNGSISRLADRGYSSDQETNDLPAHSHQRNRSASAPNDGIEGGDAPRPLTLPYKHVGTGGNGNGHAAAEDRQVNGRRAPAPQPIKQNHILGNRNDALWAGHRRVADANTRRLSTYYDDEGDDDDSFGDDDNGEAGAHVAGKGAPAHFRPSAPAQPAVARERAPKFQRAAHGGTAAAVGQHSRPELNHHHHHHHDYGDYGNKEDHLARPPSSTADDTDLAQTAPHTDDGSDVPVRHASDTTVPTQEGAPLDQQKQQQLRIQAHEALLRRHTPVVDTEALEAKLRQVRMQDEAELMSEVLDAWREFAQYEAHLNAAGLQQATHFDDEDVGFEVLDIWHEEAAWAREQRLAAEAAVEREAYVATMERRAGRAYEIYLIGNALSRWRTRALDEADRTAVARRHLVRKRAFDGWKSQHVADEAKVRNFILIHTLQRWSEVALLHEIRGSMAAQRDQQLVAGACVDKMLVTYKERVADRFYQPRIMLGCFGAWLARTQDALDYGFEAAELDERDLLEEVVTIWRDEAYQMQYTARDGQLELLVRECRTRLQSWQDEARLRRLLREYQAGDDERLQRGVLGAWRAAANESRRDGEFALALPLQEPLDFWLMQAKLARFVTRNELRTKEEVLRHWMLEEQLAWYRRHLERMDIRGVIEGWQAAARQEVAERDRFEQDADYVSDYHCVADALEHWQAAAEPRWVPKANADLICLYRTARPLMQQWRERSRAKTEDRVAQKREADYLLAVSIATHVLDRWPAAAENAKRERLMRSLRHFRRNYKIDLASECLEKWSVLAVAKAGEGRRARNVGIHYKKEDIIDWLGHWREAAVGAQEVGQVAAEAEAEMWLSMWQGRVQELQEDALDAEFWDERQTLQACWRRWEFEAIELDGKKRTADALAERNDQRRCAQVLDEWRTFAVPGADVTLNPFDPRMSTLSRRTGRSILGLSTRTSVPPTPTATGTMFDLPMRPRRTPARPNWQPPETPRFPTASQLGRPRTTAPPATESPMFPTASQLGRPATTVPTTTTTSRLQTPGFLTTSQQPRGTATSARFTTRSVQFAPSPLRLPDFDEESLLPGMEDNDPGFMSTPTRWTGSARPLGYRPSGSVIGATTTPSAILASPYERELRREYGGGGRGAARAVEFADITEVSEGA